MTARWKIQETISRSAALAYYLLIAGFFIIVALLGIAERLFFEGLILPVLSLTLVQVCSLLSLGYTAVVFDRRKLRLLSGWLLLLLIAKLLWSDVNSEQELSGIPLPILCLLLLLAALSLILPLQSRQSFYCWRITAACCLTYGCYLQLSLWFPQLSVHTVTPFSSSLIPVMLISGGIALALRQHFTLRIKERLTSSTIIAIVMFQAGYAIWFALTIYDIRYETRLAEQRIQRVALQVHKQLAFSESLFQRAKTRWQLVSDEQRLTFMLEDLNALTQAYELIYGAIVYDDDLTPLAMIGNAAELYPQGLLNNLSVVNWLAEAEPAALITINGASLKSSTPFMMLRLNLLLNAGQPVRVLILINLHQALTTDYAENGTRLKLYLEVMPELLISADEQSFDQATLAELEQRYRYFFKIHYEGQAWRDNPFYVFVTDTHDLQARSRLHQTVLWVALVFCCTFVLAADRTRQLRKEKAKLYNLARFDDITGLLRRDAFYQATENPQSDVQSLPEAMIFIDLDGFKPINDSFGHDVGDKLLSEMATRIQFVVGEQALLARFSGDEFLVYLPSCTAAMAEQLASALLQRLARPITAVGFNVYLTASIGIVINVQAGQSSQLLTQLADVAMSYAKLAGGNTYRFYQHSMAEDYRHTMAIRNKLQAALDAGGLQVFYQPLIDFNTGRVVSVESLVRWFDQGVFVPPADFIPIAEQTGQIIQLGEQVTEMVLRDLAEHPQLSHLSAAINVSSQQLRRYDFVGFLKKALVKFAIPAERICIELTESILLDDQTQTTSLPEQIKQLGCLLALDDFGTGFSSLSYLYRLPADSIKLDRSFTQDLLHDAKQRKIVEMIVSTCKQIGKTVVIEGVETIEMAELCRKLGCDRVQGYFYAKPMPLTELLVYLQQVQAH